MSEGDKAGPSESPASLARLGRWFRALATAPTRWFRALRSAPTSLWRWLRLLGAASLAMAAFGLGALSQRGLSERPARKPESVPKAAQTVPRPAPVKAAEPPTIRVEALEGTTANTNSVTISGSVADEFGRALPDALVLAGREIPQAMAPAVGELGVIAGPVPAIPIDTPPSVLPNGTGTRTDRDGKFSISNLPAGRLQVFATLAGYGPSLVSLEGLAPGQTRENLLMVLRTPVEVQQVDEIANEQALANNPELARISGNVLDVLGRPVPYAFVQTDEGDATTRTDANGAFTLLGVSPGVLRLIAQDEHAGRAESREVRARKGDLLSGVLLHLPSRHVPSTAPAPSWPTAVRTPAPAALVTPKRAPAALVSRGGLVLEARPSGVFVNFVDANSAPGKAGIAAGDLVLSIDDEPVLSVSQAHGMLRDPAGQIARAKIQRGSKKHSVRWKRPGLRYAPGKAR